MLNSSQNHPRKSLVFYSTNLCLYDKTWPCGNPNKRKRKRKRNTTDDPDVSCAPINNKITKTETNIARMRFHSYEEEQRYNVSTELTLFTDPWTIKKKLTTSDLGHLSRLLLQTSPVQDHILKYLPNDDQNSLKEGLGSVAINVYDHDTHSTHELILKRWFKLNSFVLNGGWRLYFVRRRGLRKGDQIGLFWDRSASRLNFRVLSRAAIQDSVDQKEP